MAFIDGFNALKDRGFIKQCTDFEKVEKLFTDEAVTMYVGIDPTADSLHIGHTVPLFAMHHLQQAGHRPLTLVGGGTARIGDPSGKTEMRQILSYEDIHKNVEAIRKQIEHFVDYENGNALMMNNADWLSDLNYIDFLREIGRHFSVNRMLSFETYKMRLETGLSFIEFNYQLLQAYDFYILNEKTGCKLQIGGDDQWGNIVAGIDLTRRMNGNEVFGLTFNLVTRSDGKKMGKTEKGALFLDPNRISPFDFFQYWRNVADADVGKFLKLFTFLPMQEIYELEKWEGQKINAAKEKLAYEVTKIIHGEEEAKKALGTAQAAFSEGSVTDRSAMPSLEIASSLLHDGLNILDLFAMTDLCSSKSEARRLVQQGGARINDVQYNDLDFAVTAELLEDGELLLKAGKKRYFRIILSD